MQTLDDGNTPRPDDASTDPNLVLQNQRQIQPTPPAATQPAPIPAIPPLAVNQTPPSTGSNTPLQGLTLNPTPATTPDPGLNVDPQTSNGGILGANANNTSSSIPTPPPLPTTAPYTTTDGSGNTYVGGSEQGLPPGASSYVSAFAQAPTKTTPSTPADFASGVTAYGKTWLAGTQPPAGLSPADLQTWAHNNPNNIGYDPGVWQSLANGTPITTSSAPIVAPNQTGPESYLEGGQTFTNLADATAAKAAQDAQLATNPTGSANLATLQPGATGYGSGVQAQLAAEAAGTNGSSGSGNDAGTPSSGVTLGSAVPISSGNPGTATGGSSVPSSTGPVGDGSAANPYTANNVAIGSTILPNADPRLTALQGLVDSSASTLGNVDRTQIAQQLFDQFNTSTAPAYQAALRSATQAAAGTGRIGSGMLRTSYGDLANQRDQQLQTAQQGFMTDALNGTIQDNLNNVNALSGLEGQQFGEQTTNNNQLDQQQQNQNSLEEQAFDRALEQYQLQQQSTQQQFNNGVTLTNLGSSGNPADYITQMAAQLGVDPSALASLASQLGSSSVTSPSTPSVTGPSSTTGGLTDAQIEALINSIGSTPIPGVQTTAGAGY
jgi:hypothetical protein